MRKTDSPPIFKTIPIVSLIFLLFSCAAQKELTKPQPGVAFSEEDYLNLIDARTQSFQSFQGSGKLKISNSTKSDSATGVILIKRPGKVRLESFSFFGQAIFFFASQKDTFSIFIPKENKFFTGANSLENIQKVLPLDVSVDEFSYYLLGGVRKNDDDSVVIKFLEDRNIYKIYYYGEDKKVLWFDPEFQVITKCAVFNSDDDLISVVNFSRFNEVQGAMMPMLITIKFLELDAKIEVEYDQATINGDIKDEMFRLDVPGGARVIDLDL